MLDGEGAVAREAAGGGGGAMAEGPEGLFEREEGLGFEQAGGDEVAFGGAEFGKEKAVEDFDGGENVEAVSGGEEGGLGGGAGFFGGAGFGLKGGGSGEGADGFGEFDGGGVGGARGGGEDGLGGEEGEGAGENGQGAGAEEARGGELSGGLLHYVLPPNLISIGLLGGKVKVRRVRREIR